MNGATIQAKLNRGRGIAAKAAGHTFTLYRPSSAAAPTAPGNSRGVMYILLATSFGSSPFSAPNLHGDPIWQAIMDATATLPGDYVIDATGATYFIMGIEQLHPIAVIECNRTISILRPAGQPALGASTAYGGDIVSAEVPVMTAWPASVQNGTKGERSDANLPGDVRLPWSMILLPNVPGVIIRSADVITDDIGRRMKVSAAELTSLGWRLTASLEAT